MGKEFKEILDDIQKLEFWKTTIFSFTLQIFSFVVGWLMIVKEINREEIKYKSIEFMSFKAEFPTAIYIFILVITINFGIVFGSKLIEAWNKRSNQ
jgi:hypothetical protein